MKLAYRTVWISDVHLGTRGCKAEFLLDFLKHVECECLYLVGDIIDLWKLKTGWYWPPLHSDVLRAVLDKVKKGSRVVYIPGNHDEFFRDYAGSLLAGVEVMEKAVHETADGRKFLVLHGDEFDGVVCTSKWLALLGSEAYDLLLFLNRLFNQFRRKLGFPYWSLSAYLKHKVKNAVNFISDYEKTLIHAARDEKVDGVICGHIHHAAITDMEGLAYCNCGDWVESCTALVEDFRGALAVLHWADESAYLLTEFELEDRANKRRLAAAN
ncbi:Ser/Thr protein phosphatase family protein, UDP-2,3-diacylglucosamine hydrolase homolog [Candidatus Methylocalor cossyra]|uniref:Ser/Thr protein phosphatase family protein, UDP-2,3-diacylglucosamine hydrolase homolog n=1 Tax=Candidatus Methylocalor cossyra TaxID=3108543 RepID=A0ABM9NKI0_9GAMM